MVDPELIKKIVSDTISASSALVDSARTALLETIQKMSNDELLALYDELISEDEAEVMPSADEKLEDEFIMDVSKELDAAGADDLTKHNTVDALVKGFSDKKVKLVKDNG